MSFQLSIVLCMALVAADKPSATPAQPGCRDQIRAQARALSAEMRSALGRAFLAAAEELPTIADRPCYVNRKTRQVLGRKGYESSTPEARAGFEPDTLTEENYYLTKYGTPLAYARAIDLLGSAGCESLKGRRVLDFGYGGAGQLRMMASLGAEVVGMDVDPFLREIYSEPADQGEIGANGGRLKLVCGRWPAEKEAVAAAGTGFDLIISKNTLKRGYVRPREKVDPRMTINLGVSPEKFLAEVAAALKPGGWLVIYNVCPAPNQPGRSYSPMADGNSPFTRAEYEALDLEVVRFDVDDSATIRRFGHIFGWDAGERPMNLENDISARYTIARKKNK